MQGTIHRVIRGKGFGFIVAEDRQYFFHHSEVRDTEFKRLIPGDVVDFQPHEEGEGKNPRGTDVVVLVKKERLPRVAQPLAPVGQGEVDGPHPGAARPAGPRRATRSSADGDDYFGVGVAPGGDADDREFVSEAHPGSHGASSSSRPQRQPSAGGRGPGDRGGRGGGDPNRRGTSNRAPGGRGSGGRGPGGRDGMGRAPGGRDGGGRSREPRAGRPARPKEVRPKAVGEAGASGEGVVRAVNPKHGYGFIETPGGDVFFHKSGVRAEAFEALAIGTRVAFVFAVGERGCQANDVAALPSA